METVCTGYTEKQLTRRLEGFGLVPVKEIAKAQQRVLEVLRLLLIGGFASISPTACNVHRETVVHHQTRLHCTVTENDLRQYDSEETCTLCSSTAIGKSLGTLFTLPTQVSALQGKTGRLFSSYVQEARYTIHRLM